MPIALNTILYYNHKLNEWPEAISDLGSLTRVQIETLQLHTAIRKSAISVHEALTMRKKLGISRGTHYRILSQAKKNVKQSLFTVAMAVQMELVKPEDVQKLISSVSAIPSDVDPEKLPELVAVLRAVADRIVMS